MEQNEMKSWNFAPEEWRNLSQDEKLDILDEVDDHPEYQKLSKKISELQYQLDLRGLSSNLDKKDELKNELTKLIKEQSELMRKLQYSKAKQIINGEKNESN